MARTDLITKKRYNDLQARIAAVLGTADTGYGSNVGSSQITGSPLPLIQAVDMQKLRTDMVLARQHQTGTIVLATDLPMILKDSIINDADYTNFFEPFMTNIETYKWDMADNQSTTPAAVSPGGLSTRSTSWNNQVKHTVRFDFGTALKANYFFNAGGEIQLNANLASPVGAKSTSWNAFLASLKTIKIKHHSTASTGAGTGSALGYYSLTGSPQAVFTANDTGTYAANSYAVTASKTGQYVDVSILFNDAVAETPSDLLVSGTLTSSVTYRIATGNNVSLAAPTVATTYELTSMPGYQVTLTANSGTPGIAFEGSTVVASVSVFSGPSTVWYFIGGNVSSADLTAPVVGGNIAMTGQITLVNGQHNFNIQIKEDGILDSNTLQLFISDIDPTLPNANQLASSNIITIIDTVSLTVGSVSTEINETTNKQATINITTTGIPNDTPIIWEVTGETGQDVSNRLDIVPPNTSATTGTVTVADSTAYFQIAAKANNTTDGDIRLKIRARWESNGSTVIQSSAFYLWLRDTSGTPVPSISLYQNPNWLTTGVNEGTGISVDVTTQNVPNNATVNWTITNASGTTGITATDFSPASLSGIAHTIVPSGSTTGTCNIPLTIAADSSFNEGSETFILTASVIVASQTYSGTCRVKINDTSTFPGLFVKGANYTDPNTKIVYTKLTLSMTSWPVGSIVGDKFNYTVKAYATSDTGFTNPLITFTPGEFVNSTNSSYDVGIAQPHQDFNVVATISNAKYYPSFTSTLAVSTVSAPTATVIYSPDGTANVDSNVTYTVSNGTANGYYYLETKTGSTYTRSSMRQLDANGAGTGTFTSNSVADVITRINCVSGNITTDHTTHFIYSTESVSMVQTAPYYAGAPYTAKILNAKVGDSYTVGSIVNASIPVTSGTIVADPTKNTFQVIPSASGSVSAVVTFAQSGHTPSLSFTATGQAISVTNTNLELTLGSTITLAVVVSNCTTVTVLNWSIPSSFGVTDQNGQNTGTVTTNTSGNCTLVLKTSTAAVSGSLPEVSIVASTNSYINGTVQLRIIDRFPLTKSVNYIAALPASATKVKLTVRGGAGGGGGSNGDGTTNRGGDGGDANTVIASYNISHHSLIMAVGAGGVGGKSFNNGTGGGVGGSWGSVSGIPVISGGLGGNAGVHPEGSGAGGGGGGASAVFLPSATPSILVFAGGAGGGGGGEYNGYPGLSGISNSGWYKTPTVYSTWPATLKTYGVWKGSYRSIVSPNGSITEAIDLGSLPAGQYTVEYAADDEIHWNIDYGTMYSAHYPSEKTTTITLSQGQHTLYFTATNTVANSPGSGAIVIKNQAGSIIWSTLSLLVGTVIPLNGSYIVSGTNGTFSTSYHSSGGGAGGAGGGLGGEYGRSEESPATNAYGGSAGVLMYNPDNIVGTPTVLYTKNGGAGSTYVGSSRTESGAKGADGSITIEILP
jgi:hypothetical protein